MPDFCTYFDENYLTRGLALYQSLCRHERHFRLWALCLSPAAYQELNRLDLPGLIAISLEDFERDDTDLLASKASRSRIEYYFTCTPSLPLYILARHSDVQQITYLDADLFFFAETDPLFKEIGDRSIAIVAHRFPPDLRHLERYGVYNVGWLTFRRDAEGMACLRRWRAECLDWCYDRVEAGRFADQKYLDVWPEHFQRLAVLQHKGANVAPWNLRNYAVRWWDDKVWVDEARLIFFHFHGFKQTASGAFDFNLRAYRSNLDAVTARQIYQPYVEALQRSMAMVTPEQRAPRLASGIRTSAPVENSRRTPMRESRKDPEESAPERAAGAAQPSALLGLRRIRSSLTKIWLHADPRELPNLYRGQAGRLHRSLSAGPVKSLPVSADERLLLDNLFRSMSEAHGSDHLARCLLVAMLHLQPHQVPCGVELEDIPEWLTEDYLHFLLTPPEIYRECGEADAYGAVLSDLINRASEAIRRQPDSAIWKRIAGAIHDSATFIPLYFLKRNLKSLSIRRSDISDAVLKARGQTLGNDPVWSSKPGHKVRLGIYSHSIGPGSQTFATIPIFSQLERNGFEVIYYHHIENGNWVESWVRQRVDRINRLPLTTRQAVEAIRADRLDVLLFADNITAGQTRGSVLSHYRMAPVQCLHFCNPISSGRRLIDHFLIGDLIADRIDPGRCFSESLLRIEGSGICFDFLRAPDPGRSQVTRRALGIPDDRLMMVSGANCFKILPEVVHLWARILREIPSSLLVLYPFGPAWSGTYPKHAFKAEVARVLGHHGLEGGRVMILDTIGQRHDILRLNEIADLYLDAVPYSGATSLIDPLLSGVPPIVCEGPDLRFAQGPAMLKEIDMPELIAQNEADYVRLAVQLGSCRDRREAIRDRIRHQMMHNPPFLDSRLYAQRVARALQSLFPGPSVRVSSNVASAVHAAGLIPARATA